MDKSAELLVLDEAVARLGPDSYVGPWLASVRYEVQRDMRCDREPTASLTELRALSNELAARHLRQDAREKELRAREQAVQERERTLTYREGSLERTRADLRAIAARLAA